LDPLCYWLLVLEAAVPLCRPSLLRCSESSC